LTAEPKPEVIVIDLRETWTVGPLVKPLDRTISSVLPYWRTSRLSVGADALVEVTERAVRTRYGQAIASVLAPPGSPTEEKTGAKPDMDEREATNEANKPPTTTESPEESTVDTVDTGDENSHGPQ
jgi:hypothetical protein